MSSVGPYEVYAVKYAERDAMRSEHFLGGDPHDVPMPMDYFVWAIVGEEDTWIVDTGFGELDAGRRERRLLRSVSEGLNAIGIDASEVEDVIITHLHYDHAGGLAQFPKARFHLQDREMFYATGRHMTRRVLSHGYTPEHVADLIHEVYRNRVIFHDGDTVLTPGLSLHFVGGHTMGLQVVRVRTEIGWIVLASDATHYYENMEACRPSPIVYDVGDMIEAYDRIRALADSPSLVVPGHDPLVLERYPAVSEELEGVAVRLSTKPS